MSYQSPPNQQLYYDQVWALVRKVPRGMVITYGRIARMLPIPEGISAEDYQLSASRWVGLAMAACPDDVPWQRVVNSQGKFSYSDAGKQAELLAAEGVYPSKGKVDLVEYEWSGTEQGDEVRQGSLF